MKDGKRGKMSEEGDTQQRRVVWEVGRFKAEEVIIEMRWYRMQKRRREGEGKKDEMGDRRRTGKRREKGRKGQSLDETERLENERGGINDNKRVISVKLG